MKRRDFCIRVGGVLLAVPLAVACSDDGDDGPEVDANVGNPDAAMNPDAAQGGQCVGGVVSSISVNHGHELVLPEADIVAGVEKTYDITGTSVHPHTIVVTAADFAMLQGNQSVTITSSNDSAHTHDVTISCPS